MTHLGAGSRGKATLDVNGCESGSISMKSDWKLMINLKEKKERERQWKPSLGSLAALLIVFSLWLEWRRVLGQEGTGGVIKELQHRQGLTIKSAVIRVNPSAAPSPNIEPPVFAPSLCRLTSKCIHYGCALQNPPGLPVVAAVFGNWTLEALLLPLNLGGTMHVMCWLIQQLPTTDVYVCVCNIMHILLTIFHLLGWSYSVQGKMPSPRGKNNRA